MDGEKLKTHRPGLLKQSNKAHKSGRHRSKGMVANEQKGKVSLKTITKKSKHLHNRDQRRNQLHQIRRNKWDSIIYRKRFGNIGDFSAPSLICILPLNSNIDPISALTALEHCTEDCIVHKVASTGVTYITVPHLKKRLSFVVPPVGPGHEFSVLDCLKVCDTTLFLVSALHNFFDEWSSKMFEMIVGQGVPTPVFGLMDLESISPKRRQQTKVQYSKKMEELHLSEKIMCLDTNADVLNLMRRFSQQRIEQQRINKNYPNLFGESISFVKNNDVPLLNSSTTVNDLGTLKVTGFLRGEKHLNINHLVHIPGLGDFQMSQIDSVACPYRTDRENSVQEGVMFTANSNDQMSLQRENIPDEMDCEQNWPTEEEIIQARKETKTSRLIKRIPKGMSDYQACWIPDIEEVEVNETIDDKDENHSDDDDNAIVESNNEDDDYMTLDDESDDGDEFQEAEEDLEEFDKITVSEAPAINDEKYDLAIDIDEERRALETIKSARVDKMYPDEIDTPLEAPARKRFEKYRGLESFRTSNWDVKEQLPFDYARIYQFKNFGRTKQRILKELDANTTGCSPGCYITIHIKNVSEMLLNAWLSGQTKDNRVLIVFGMLPHEQQMSVVNCTVRRSPDSTIPIKSKEQLIVQCGYRRYIVNPIYSAHTNGDKHKYERYFRTQEQVVATFYAPIQFPPAPVLFFQHNPNGTLRFVASGFVLSCNPDRIILKRIVLSGHPLKINRKSAVIRYMFFNKEDVEYFKPIKLRTKCGRLGHIKESLGTHGHMKCIFDGQLKSLDTVFLYLYKRIFPKWTYDDYVARPALAGMN